MRKVVCIIQARTDSTRLPQKALCDIVGKPLIVHVFDRIKFSTLINSFILATTTRSIDTPLVELIQNLGIPVFRGDCDDVLDRYYKAACHFKAENIVRITGDCPLIDPQIADVIIKVFLNNTYDYVTNTLHRTYPDGLDVEIFSFDALEKAWKKATLPSEREHVTPFIRNNPDQFSLYDVKNPIDYSTYRWTVDRQEDLLFVREVFRQLYPKKKIFYMNDIVDLLDKHPELLKINSGIQRNEGYLRSLQKDKILKKVKKQ